MGARTFPAVEETETTMQPRKLARGDQRTEAMSNAPAFPEQVKRLPGKASMIRWRKWLNL